MQLSDDQFDQREEATKRLWRSANRHSVTSSDPEVRGRAKDIGQE